MTTFLDGAPEDWPELFKQGKLHVVCVASGGLTTCDFVASTLSKMRQEQEVWPLTKRVNRLGEAGTFWPRFALTVVPQFAWESRAVSQDLSDFLRKSFEDVAEANREHVKLPSLFLDLNPYGGNYQRDVALPIARDILGAEPSILTVWIANQSTYGRSRPTRRSSRRSCLRFAAVSPRLSLGVRRTKGKGYECSRY